MKEHPEPVYLTLEEISLRCGLDEARIRQFIDFGIFPSQQSSEPSGAFSEEEVPYLLLLNRLSEDLEVNLPGLEVIVHMRQRLEKLQREVRLLQGQLRELEHQHVRIWNLR